MQYFKGFHSEWNLVCPGGWDYQRITQIIGKTSWLKLNKIGAFNLELDFDHPLFYPVDGLVQMLADAHYDREGRNPGLIAVVAEEETLEDVTENKNLARRLNRIDGLSGALMAPQELEITNGRVGWRGQPVSVMFMDFNSDVLQPLQKKFDLKPVFQAIDLALTEGNYILQKTVPLSIWAEDIPLVEENGHPALKTCQTDFRCLIGPAGTLGFICRFGGVPTKWADCLTLEKMWLTGELADQIKVGEKKLEIARLQPWNGSRAIIASDGLFNFGAGPVSY